MKKEHKIILSLMTIFLIAIVILAIQGASAADQPQYPLGINPEQIQNMPQTPEEIENTTANYLKTQLGQIISKIPGLVKTHEFLKAHPLFFTILFNEPYSITWVFFCLVLLWLYTMAGTTDIVRASPIVGSSALKEPFSFIIGIGTAIILSQLGILKAIVVFCLNLLYAPNLWWVRLILGVLIILIFFVIYYAKGIAEGWLKAKYKAGKEEALEQEAKEGKAFREGAKEAQEITEPLRKIKRQNPLM